MISVDASGTITAEFSQSIVAGATIYTLDSVSSSGVELKGGLVIPFSVTALANPGPGFEDWFWPANWSDGAFFGIAQAGLPVAELIGDVLDRDIPKIVPDFYDSINALETLGPTDRTFSTDVGTIGYHGASFPISAELDVAYDVTIGDGARMSMDQDIVVLNSLTVAPAGTLQAGFLAFTVDTDLVNEGSLEILSGPGGTVQGAFDNFGEAKIDGQLDAQSIDNTGVLDVLYGTTFTDGVPTVNTGTIIAPGILSLTSSLDSTDGTIEALSGGTVEVGSGGTIVGATFVGSGVFEGLSTNATNFSVVQDVTLEPGATYTAPYGNFVALRGGIVNSRTLAAPGIGAFVIDGTVTLSGGGVVALDGGAIDPLAVFDLPGTSELINVDNTISRQRQHWRPAR